MSLPATISDNQLEECQCLIQGHAAGWVNGGAISPAQEPRFLIIMSSCLLCEGMAFFTSSQSFSDFFDVVSLLFTALVFHQRLGFLCSTGDGCGETKYGQRNSRTARKTSGPWCTCPAPSPGQWLWWISFCDGVVFHDTADCKKGNLFWWA